MSPGWLEGAVALVTGGGSGIGLAVVRRFLAEGARVGVLDRDPGPAASEVGCVGTPGDVTSAADNRRAVAEVVDAFGRLDVFVGNAGIHDGATALVDLPEDGIDAAFDEIFAVNVKGYLLGARAALPQLYAARGSMIFTISNAGFYAGGGGPLYTASKHAGVGIVRQLAHELAPHVRVNGVAPAGTVTGLRGPPSLGQDRPLFADGASWEQRIRASKPLDIVPTGQDHTGSYVFLASAANSRAMTGEILRSDGGLGVRGLTAVAGGHGLPESLGDIGHPATVRDTTARDTTIRDATP